MSSHDAQHSVTVPVFIGASGKPSDISESEPYMKDYIVKQNLILQQDNKILAEEARQIGSSLEDLEEEHDHLERKYTKTKLYIKDFYHLNKCYKDLFTADRQWLTSIKSQKDREDLVNTSILVVKYCNPKIYLTCIYVLLTALSCQMFSPTLAMISLIAFHFTFTFSYLNTNPTLERKMEAINTEIRTLLARHKEKEGEIRELTKTMDIVSEFMDNAL